MKKLMLYKGGVISVVGILLGIILLGFGVYGGGFFGEVRQTVLYVVSRSDVIFRTFEAIAGAVLVLLSSVELGKWIQRRADARKERGNDKALS